jgi:hypothetical protein
MFTPGGARTQEATNVKRNLISMMMLLLQVLRTRRCFQELLIRISMAASKGLQGIVSERIKALYDFSLKAGWLSACLSAHTGTKY